MNCYSQTIESLQSEISKAELELVRSKKLLAANKNNQKQGVTELKLVQSNISNRRLIIVKLDKQLKIIKNSIYINTMKKRGLNTDLLDLEKDYTKSIINRYKDLKQDNFLLFIFSAGSFFEMNIRGEYLERLASMAKIKSVDITKVTLSIDQNNKKLTREQKQQDEILESRKKGLSELSSDLRSQENILSSLKKEEGSINSQITENNKLISKLQDKIEEIIKLESTKHNTNVSEEDIARNIKLSSNFASNKGKFPPPVAGVVVSKFGLQAHPTQKNIKVKNNGIDIQTAQRNVYSIFKGEVVKVFFFQGLNSSVMVRHGNYISVYCNLQKVRVEAGDEVENREVIGTMVDSKSKALHFELWKGNAPQNPSLWLDL